MGNQNSGRGTQVDESLRSKVVNTSWKILDKLFAEDPLKLKSKKAQNALIAKQRSYALEIAKRSVPQDITHGGNVSLTWAELMKKVDD
ncbi:MAG: hypothetical protein V1709_08540 [Planctomycetota bacterium]